MSGPAVFQPRRRTSPKLTITEIGFDVVLLLRDENPMPGKLVREKIENRFIW